MAPWTTRLRSPNGSAGVPIASELAASVALDRSTPPPSVIRGHVDGRLAHQTQGVVLWRRRRRPRRNRKATEPRLEHRVFDVAKRPGIGPAVCLFCYRYHRAKTQQPFGLSLNPPAASRRRGPSKN